MYDFSKVKRKGQIDKAWVNNPIRKRGEEIKSKSKYKSLAMLPHYEANAPSL
jgi:hypothetical protein